MDYNPFAPGLEVKYAMEEGTKCGAKLVHLGYEFDEHAMSRFYHENRYTVLKSVWYYLTKMNSHYNSEMIEFRDHLHAYGVKKFIESNFDQYTINW